MGGWVLGWGCSVTLSPCSLALLPHPIPGTHWSRLCTKFLHQTSKGEFASSLDPSLIL